MSERDLDCITDLNAQLLKAWQQHSSISNAWLSELGKYAKQSHGHAAELLTINLKFRDLIAEKDDQIAKLQKLM